VESGEGYKELKDMQTKDPNEANASLQGSGLSPFLLWLIWVIWLPFAIPDIIGFFQSHPPLVRLIATLVAVALFFAVYIWATWRNVQRLVGAAPTGRWQASPWPPIAVLVALSLTIVLLYKGIGTPFIFTSAYMAGRLPTGRAIQAVVALALLIAVFGLRDPNWSYLGQGIVLVLVVGIVTISMVRAVTTGRELRAAREEIARLAVMTERLRIARDLHDLLGHNLSLIALKSELAGRLIGVAPERATVEIGDVERVARSTLQEVREAVSAYRQPTLSSELHAAHEILFAAGIAYRYEGDESTMGTLPTAVETLLSWAVREGVTNVIRHSRARQCTVRMQRENHSACVEVIDDGVARPQDTASSGGNGLRGLAERVEALDGSFEAGPRLGGGYRLAVSVPVVQSERSDNHAERSEQR
jgi:two-component system sensor histidine kinase DesK